MPHAYTAEGEVDWDREGELAILDLLGDKHAAPWPEVIARISNSQWKDYGKVQPLQLEEARIRLMNRPEDHPERVERDESAHARPIVLFHLASPTISNTAFEAERGRRRGLYRSFLRWTGDSVSCGHHAERVVVTSMRQAAGDGVLTVPPQRRGQVDTVRGHTITRGPLDAIGFLPHLPDADSSIPFLVEVKNVSDWIYAWDQRLWELLVKAAEIGQHEPVLPILACPYSDITAARAAGDIGFLRVQYEEQLFTDDQEKVPTDRFQQVKDEFGLTAVQCPEDSPNAQMVDFFSHIPRRRMRNQVGRWTEWYRLLGDRFHQLSPVILNFDALAGPLDAATRSNMHRAFFEAVRAVADWNFQGGWARNP